jgi:hypothetical protein
MRVLAILAVSAAALPLVALADPAPVQAPAPAATQAAPMQAAAQTAPSPTMTAQVTPAPAAPAAASADADVGADLDKVVCRSTAPPTGSRLGGGRECHTVRQWNERERNDQRMLEQHQSVAYHGPGGG